MNASAIKSTDKFIIVPEGAMPQLVLGKDVIPVSNVTTPTMTPMTPVVGGE